MKKINFLKIINKSRRALKCISANSYRSWWSAFGSRI